MSGNKIHLYVLAALMAMLPGLSSADTLDDLGENQVELLRAKAQADIDAAKKKDAPAVPVPQIVDATPKWQHHVETPKLVAVYGLGDTLHADLLVNGAVVTAGQGGTVEGWKVKEIAPSVVVLKKGRVLHSISLSLMTDDSLEATRVGAIGGVGRGGLPPIPYPMGR